MILQEMIVTDSEGKTQTSDGKVLSGQSIQSEDMYSFYAIKRVNPPFAKPSPETQPVRVRLTMPLGGELNGMYRFPRVGEKVLVAVEGAAHYLISYLPTAEQQFSPKDQTDVFDKDAQVLRYKQTGGNTADAPYSEIGFYSEATEWKEKKGSSNKKLEDKSKLPIVDKIKVFSTGDIETRAQNYNETSAKRIALFAGYGDDIEKRKVKLRKNMKDGNGATSPEDREAFPVLPSDAADQDSTFFSGDIQMRAKNRFVVKAEDKIEFIVGNSIMRLDSSGITLISRKTSGSSINAWDSSITVSAHDGLKMFGSRVELNSAYKFSISDAFGGNLYSFGGILRITGADVRLRSMCKAAYVLKGVTAAASFATNVASASVGIMQEQGLRKNDGGMVNALPSYFSLGAGVAGTVVGVNWGFNSMPDIEDTASGLAAVLDFIIMLLGLVKIALDKAVLSKNDQRFGGRAGLNLAMMVAEYGIVMGLFVKLNLANQNWMHAASIMMSFKGDMDISANMYKQTAITETRAASPTAGLATSMIASMGKSFAAQSWWKILLESIGAAALLGGAGAGLYYGCKHSSSDNADLRDELEAL